MIALLDLDGTLVDRSAGFAAWARSFADRWSLPDDDHAWLGELDRTVAQRRQFFEGVSRRFPEAGPPETLWQDFRAQMPLLTPAFPDVLERLDTLRSAGWRLMVVTNGRTDNQVGKLRRTGIADRVDGWCVSEEAGVAKPDAAIFASALARLGAADGAGCWMVGDDATADVAGGHAAGLRTHWISHGRPWPLRDLRPERTSVSPGDALALLAGLSAAEP
ncbi:HAD family hydrolase [Cellulomonas sp. NS3]|uniref:HAD family hydrolase n=1 Tax=Cellulomonas sp. NS3 TaxID=2973977 RepID=UPI00216246E3|nr:HAD family hydrolase [Cellulomonas sp. NS3]